MIEVNTSFPNGRELKNENKSVYFLSEEGPFVRTLTNKGMIAIDTPTVIVK